MLELGTRLDPQYRVEYHKLEYEELGWRIHFGQHCNSVRGTCVLLHKWRAPETEVEELSPSTVTASEELVY